MEDSLQSAKTRWAHYQTGYHLVWIPKYRRRDLVDAVANETKRLIADCCRANTLPLIAIETDMDHVHVFVSAPPRWSPAQMEPC